MNSPSTITIAPNGIDRSGSAGLLINGKAVLHHLGFVVPSIAASAESFAASISAAWDGQIVHDPVQRVRLAFFNPADVRNPVYELVEPVGADSPVTRFLKKGGGFHHVCYEIDDLEQGLEKARRASFGLVAAPAPAVAFGGRRIAWVWSRNRLLMELLERA